MRQNLIRLLGVIVLLIVLFILLKQANPNSFDSSNLIDVLNRHGFLGIITIGAALLIIIGGIDLSIGSVVGLSAILFSVMMEKGYHPWVALPVTLACGPIIGTIYALLITRLRLQPFLVTLCGMFIYRGMARELTAKNTGLEQIRSNHPDFSSSIDTMRELLIGKDAERGRIIP